MQNVRTRTGSFNPPPPPRRPTTPAAALPPPVVVKEDAVAKAADIRPWFERCPELLPIPFPAMEKACGQLMQLNRQPPGVDAEHLTQHARWADSFLRYLIASGEPARARRLAEDGLDPTIARQVLGRLGFIASCVTHHRLAGGLAAVLPVDLTYAMLSLGQRIGQVPRDTAKTFWFDHPAYACLGDQTEVEFGVQVRAIEAAFLTCAAKLSPFLRGDKTFLDAQHDITAAVGEVRGLPALALPAAPGHNRFLSFIHPLDLGGRVYAGPHGARTYGWDLIRGIADHRIGPDGRRGLFPRVISQIVADHSWMPNGDEEIQRVLSAAIELDQALRILAIFYEYIDNGVARKSGVSDD